MFKYCMISLCLFRSATELLSLVRSLVWFMRLGSFFGLVCFAHFSNTHSIANICIKQTERWIEMFVCVLAQGNNISSLSSSVVILRMKLPSTFNYTLCRMRSYDNCHLFHFNFLQWLFIAAAAVVVIWRTEEFNGIYANHCQSSNYYYETLDSLP